MTPPAGAAARADLGDGPREAFEAIFAEAYPDVVAYARRRVASHHDADDVVAETFLVGWRRVEELVAADNPTAWLMGVARRVIANHRRGKARAARTVERTAGLAVVPAPDTADRVAGAEGADAILAALATLPERDREVLMLAAWEGLGAAEIGTVLGVSPAVASRRLFRARGRLARALGAVDESGEEG